MTSVIAKQLQGAIEREPDAEDDLADEYEPEPYTDGFVGCEDFREEDLWET